MKFFEEINADRFALRLLSDENRKAFAQYLNKAGQLPKDSSLSEQMNSERSRLLLQGGLGNNLNAPTQSDLFESLLEEYLLTDSLDDIESPIVISNEMNSFLYNSPTTSNAFPKTLGYLQFLYAIIIFALGFLNRRPSLALLWLVAANLLIPIGIVVWLLVKEQALDEEINEYLADAHLSTW